MQGYIQPATSPRPEPALAPNDKVVQWRNGDKTEEEKAEEDTHRFSEDHQRRMFIQSAFWDRLETIAAMTER
jgi:hypothetical protein